MFNKKGLFGNKTNSSLKDVKLFPKTLFFFLLAALIPIFGFTYQLHLREEDQKKVVEQQLIRSAETIASQINAWFDKNLIQINLVVQLDAFIEMDAPAQVPILKTTTKNIKWATLTFVTDLQGNAITRSDNKPLINYSDREYFKEVMSGQEIGQQVLIGKTRPIPLYCFAVPIKKISNEITGVLTQCSALKGISEYISNFKVGHTGFIFLVDDKNSLISHGNQRNKSADNITDMSGHPGLLLAKGEVTVLQHEGSKKAMTILPVAHNWKLVLQQDYDEAYSSYLKSKKNTTLMIIASIIFSLIFAFLISHSISKPIRKLTNIANAFSEGMFVKNNLDKDRGDEIGDLTRAISRLSKAIQLALVRLQNKNSNDDDIK